MCSNNQIKALNWYGSVREKLDDPKYASWFVKFKNYKGKSPTDNASNNSYHVPACDWYGNATSPPKCSGYYHDQVRLHLIAVRASRRSPAQVRRACI